MSWFQLDPQSLADRTLTSADAVPSLAQSLWRGAAGFTLVGVIGFAPWALFGHRLSLALGEAGEYAVCAFAFIAASGLLLHRLILGTGSLRRFYQLFSIAFGAYAALWIGCWMQIGGDRGEFWGLLGGTVVMALILTAAFGAWRGAVQTFAALLLCNFAGYYAGAWIFKRLIGSHSLAAMLLWGACFGLGTGAGLGLAFHLCQAKARALLAGRRGA